jgi:hypothetical protein
MSWEALAAIAAVVGLFLTAGSMRAQAEATSLANLNTVRSKIQDIQLHFGEILSFPPSDIRTQRIKVWDEVFFNEIEWLCVLYLEGLVPEGITLEHLSRPLLDYWGIFISSAPLQVQTDPEVYSRFKRVIRIIQSQRQIEPGLSSRIAAGTNTAPRVNRYSTRPKTSVDLFA